MTLPIAIGLALHLIVAVTLAANREIYFGDKLSIKGRVRLFFFGLIIIPLLGAVISLMGMFVNLIGMGLNWLSGYLLAPAVYLWNILLQAALPHH